MGRWGGYVLRVAVCSLFLMIFYQAVRGDFVWQPYLAFPAV